MDAETAAALTFEVAPADGHLRQGEILSNLKEPLVSANWASPETTEASVQFFTCPFAVVMSQECDLEQDFAARLAGKEHTQLSAILFCHAVPAEILRGNHQIDSSLWRRVRQNQHERYMVLRAIPATLDAKGEEIPELALDFKRYFTLPVLVVYEQLKGPVSRRSVLTSLYASQLTARFYAYQARIGLPVDHHEKFATALPLLGEAPVPPK